MGLRGSSSIIRRFCKVAESWGYCPAHLRASNQPATIRRAQVPVCTECQSCKDWGFCLATGRFCPILKKGSGQACFQLAPGCPEGCPPTPSREYTCWWAWGPAAALAPGHSLWNASAQGLPFPEDFPEQQQGIPNIEHLQSQTGYSLTAGSGNMNLPVSYAATCLLPGLWEHLQHKASELPPKTSFFRHR